MRQIIRRKTPLWAKVYLAGVVGLIAAVELLVFAGLYVEDNPRHYCEVAPDFDHSAVAKETALAAATAAIPTDPPVHSAVAAPTDKIPAEHPSSKDETRSLLGADPIPVKCSARTRILIFGIVFPIVAGLIAYGVYKALEACGGVLIVTVNTLIFVSILIIFFAIIIVISGSGGYMAHAPVIYLYGDEGMEVNVGLDLNGHLTCTYPEYKTGEGWTVAISPDGTLTDSEGKEYDFLFWEGEVDFDADMSQGFCVSGDQTEDLLRECAAELGLNDNETDAFVGYWLPFMENNPYNVITFQTTAFDEAAQMNISPEPDQVVRVNMLWYASDEFVQIEPQDLTGINIPVEERHGFTVVEWGGEQATRP